MIITTIAYRPKIYIKFVEFLFSDYIFPLILFIFIIEMLYDDAKIQDGLVRKTLLVLFSKKQI